MLTVQIVDEFLESKKGDESGGEDRLVKGPVYFGVIDGATDHTGLRWRSYSGAEKPGGEVLAEIVEHYFSAAPQGQEPDAIVRSLNDEIHRRAEVSEIDLSDPLKRANVSFAVFDASCARILHIGDCGFAFKRTDGSFHVKQFEKKIDRLVSDIRAAIVEVLKSHGIDAFADGQDLGRNFIKPLLGRQQELQNGQLPKGSWAFGIPDISLRYDVINGFPAELSVTTVPSTVRELILASDGFRVICSTLKKTVATLRRSLKRDPHCLKELRSTKGVLPGQTSFDDLSYLRLRLINRESKN